MLSDYLNTDFVIMDKKSEPDPFGGVLYVYTEGASFKGGAVANNTTEMRIAQQSGAKALYTLVVDRKIVLDRDQIIRRVSDKADFRIVSPTMDMTAPAHAENQFSQATMERVIL